MVSDDGEGIPPEHIDKIFERFHRVDSSRQSETGGAGLGLAICKGIVEAHGGTISASSVLGHGAVFTVRLPRVA
jgi:two-component system OmpR family sensor kinase